MPNPLPDKRSAQDSRSHSSSHSSAEDELVFSPEAEESITQAKLEAARGEIVRGDEAEAIRALFKR
jgi:hypothetical protein